MTVEQLAELVRDMRRAQRAYFKDRTQGALEDSKRLEKAVDAAVREALEQPTLFGGGAG
jgi:hypothetical protein